MLGAWLCWTLKKTEFTEKYCCSYTVEMMRNATMDDSCLSHANRRYTGSVCRPKLGIYGSDLKLLITKTLNIHHFQNQFLMQFVDLHSFHCSSNPKQCLFQLFCFLQLLNMVSSLGTDQRACFRFF